MEKFKNSGRHRVLYVGGLFFFFLEPQLLHMEVPRLGVKSELRLPADTPATAVPDLRCI